MCRIWQTQIQFFLSLLSLLLLGRSASSLLVGLKPFDEQLDEKDHVGRVHDQTTVGVDWVREAAIHGVKNNRHAAHHLQNL